MHFYTHGPPFVCPPFVCHGRFEHITITNRRSHPPGWRRRKPHSLRPHQEIGSVRAGCTPTFRFGVTKAGPHFGR
jgi:hypothetical protein